MKLFHPAIIRIHENRYSAREIAEILSVPNSTVHDDIKRFEETGLNADRAGRGKTSKART
jgi:transposase